MSPLRVKKLVRFHKEMRLDNDWLQGLDRGDNVYASYAMGDKGFASWLERVDQICSRFLQTSFFDIEDLIHPYDYYSDGVTPGEFFTDIVIEVMEYELGCVDLPEIIFSNAMWGHKRS